MLTTIYKVKQLQINVVALTRVVIGSLSNYADSCLKAPSNIALRIQEKDMMIYQHLHWQIEAKFKERV